MPLPFYLTCIALFGCGLRAWQCRNRGWGMPALIVLATTGVWYVGDALYNDYEGYVVVFGYPLLEAAWWQVLWFVIVYGAIVPHVHRLVNRKLRHKRSQILKIARLRTFEVGSFQEQIDRTMYALLVIWLILMGTALARVEFDFVGIFAPWMGEKADPWARGRIGGGIDALLSLASYLQIFLVASFGVLAALATKPTTRVIVVTVCFLSLPFFLFDRTRNTMLATTMPGLLAWVLLRLRGGVVVKASALAVSFIIVAFWLSFVMAARNEGRSVASAFSATSSVVVKKKHEGLNMFEELSWLNSFIVDGSYLPNWGQRYFAEIANVVPRALWKNKPEIGVDYAIARGFGWAQAAEGQGGIAASISTGMIGQGVVNFGRFFGPMAAALLMAFWTAVLARQDLLGAQPARLLLYATGIILTFNMGRDITLLVLYPFLFGLCMLMFWEGIQGNKPRRAGNGSIGRGGNLHISRRGRQMPARSRGT